MEHKTSFLFYFSKLQNLKSSRIVIFVVSHVVLVMRHQSFTGFATNLADISGKIEMFRLNVTKNQVLSGVFVLTVRTLPATTLPVLTFLPKHFPLN
jgi:hypothetical protein